MDETELNPVCPNWQDNGAYDYTAHLTSRGWAWEFLRRNPDFCRDLLHALRYTARSEVRADIFLIRLPPRSVDLSRWGLLFCKLDRV
jgi:hypothetical protein